MVDDCQVCKEWCGMPATKTCQRCGKKMSSLCQWCPSSPNCMPCDDELEMQDENGEMIENE